MLPEDIERLPNDSGGMYALFLSFPSDQELGFYETTLTLSQLKHNIQSLISRLLETYMSSRYHGTLKSGQTGRHLRQSLVILAKLDNVNNYIKTFDEKMKIAKSPDELRLLAALIRGLFDALPPIYIGIATEQSLRTRINQHSAGATGFSDRLASANLSRSDLRCRIYPVPTALTHLLEEYELIVQNTFFPALSEA